MIPKHYKSASSTSQNLIYDILYLLNLTSITDISVRQSKFSGEAIFKEKIVNVNNAWTIKLLNSKELELQEISKIIEKNCSNNEAEVILQEETSTVIDVYNLEVLDNHSYVTEYGVVHNCDTDFLTSGNTVVAADIIEFYKKDKVKDPLEMRGRDSCYWIWEYPDYSRNYIVSADVARGDGADYSAFHVIDIETLTQVAEYQGQMSTKEYGNFLVSVATEYNNGLLVVENANIGWAVLQQIIDRSYPNTFYSSADLQYVDIERQITNKYNAIEKKMVPGFTTTMKTRPLIVSRMEMYFRERSVDIRSVRLANELSTFIWNGNKPEAMQNHHDDLVMSLSIGLWVRDTALKLRQYGMDLTKTMINNINRVGSIDPIYKSTNLTAQQAWEMNIGKTFNDKKESLNWLL